MHACLFHCRIWQVLPVRQSLSLSCVLGSTRNEVLYDSKKESVEGGEKGVVVLHLGGDKSFWPFNEKMSSYNRRQEQRNFIKYLTDQGILDDHFEHILDLRQGESPQFLIDLINMFCSDAESCITQVNKYMNEHIIDYAKVITFVHQIRGSSSSIGGRRMALACRDLRYACDDMDHARCLEYFNMVKEEYQILKDKFNIISQMEININAHEGKKCEP